MSLKAPIDQVRAGELPGMVRWYDPRLLSRIGVRTIISNVFGQYADQRLLQAATDQASTEELISRYDYSDPHSADPTRRLSLDPDGALWVDYIADTGDGFESTFSLAYLLAQDHLDLGAAGRLPHGDLLIMGGDQCYPQATREEYKKRLIKPFEWAFNVSVPKRKLFAIPGNHDWYDGLSAFDSLFCVARDRLSSGHGNRLGGWQCPQHRSYWALKLPHDWWIWGTDIQFASYLDVSQVNYFETMAAQMRPGDKLIICIAEPSWMLEDLQGQDEDQSFFKITAIARKRNVQICAVIAGDWHHYNRYYAPELGVHFFTAGGGGAFLHPTHVLKNEISLTWPKRVDWSEPSSEAEIGDPRGDWAPGWAPGRFDMRLRARNEPLRPLREAVRDTLAPIQPGGGAGDGASASPGAASAARPARQRETKCYPNKSVSWWLSLKNLAFPIYNFPFAVGIGIIYWLVSWQFDVVARHHNISTGQLRQVSFAQIGEVLQVMPLYVLQATLSVAFVVLFGGLYVFIVNYVKPARPPGLRRTLIKLGVGSAHFLTHCIAIFSLFLLFTATNNWLAPKAVEVANTLLYWSDKAEAGVTKRIVEETLKPLAPARSEPRPQDAQPRRASPAPGGATPPLEAAVGGEQGVSVKLVRELVGLLYPLQMILIGGIIGGFIWGLYWVITGVIGRMHAEDAFGALRIKDYKNFLRMKIEPGRVTIYPIGIDRVARRRELVEPPHGVPPPAHNPALMPKSGSIPVHLIEPAIVISAADRVTD